VLPGIRSAGSTVIIKNTAYYLGGKVDSGNLPTTSILRSTIDSNGHLGPWTSHSNSLSQALFFTTLIRTKSRVYIIGGLTTAAQNYTQYAPIDKNGELGTWVNWINTPITQYRSSVISTMYKVWLLGGAGSSSEHLNTISSFEIDVNGHLSEMTVESETLPFVTAHVDITMTENFAIFYSNESNDTYSIEFNGWDSRRYDSRAIELSPNKFAGYPCASSHFSKYQQQNILKTTTTDSGISGWTTEANALTGTGDQSSAIVTSSRVYMLGGYLTNSVRYAEINDVGEIGAWNTDVNTLPSILAASNAIMTKSRVYLIGGSITWHTPTNVVYYSEIDDNGHLGSWSTGGNLPNALSAGAVVTLKDRVYYISGKNSNSNTASNQIFSSIIDSNGHLGTWATYGVSTVANGVFLTQAIRTKSRVYLIGGHDNHPRSIVQYAEIDENGDLGSWTLDSSLPGVVYWHQVIVTNNVVYLLGGHNGSTYLDTIFYAPIDNDGVIGAWVTDSNVIGINTHANAPVIVTSSKVYMPSIHSTDVRSAPFDGWDSRKNNTEAIYLPTHKFAGYPCEFSHFSKYQQQNILKTTTTDSGISGWTTEANALTGTGNQSSAIVTSSRVYMLGGYLTNSVRYAEVDNIGNIGAWNTDVNTLPSNFAASNAIITKSRVYLIGGAITWHTPTATVYYSDIDANGHLGVWNTGGNLPDTLSSGGVVIIKDRVYYISGKNVPSNSATPNIQYADIDANGHLGVWSLYPSSTVYSRMFFTQAVRTKSRVYLIGGYSPSGASNIVQYTEIDANGDLGIWNNDTNTLPGVVYGHQVVIMKNVVYLLAGHNGASYLTSIYYAPIDENGVIGSWSVDSNNIGISTNAPSIITSNKIYMPSVLSTDVRSAPFDGWDSRKNDAGTDL
jgi:N-acetylneuraminic acid mutarotase